jgi:hypothetical protein
VLIIHKKILPNLAIDKIWKWKNLNTLLYFDYLLQQQIEIWWSNVDTACTKWKSQLNLNDLAGS